VLGCGIDAVKKSSNDRVDVQAAAVENNDSDVASRIVEPQPHLSPYDDTSRLAMLPKVRAK